MLFCLLLFLFFCCYYFVNHSGEIYGMTFIEFFEKKTDIFLQENNIDAIFYRNNRNENNIIF